MLRPARAVFALASIALLAACDLPSGEVRPRAPTIGWEANLARPGVTCPAWSHFEQGRGCASGEGGASALRVVEELRMSNAFVLTYALYVLDGRVVYQWKAGAEGEEPRARTPILDARVSAGPHTLSVSLGYQGHGEGAFYYLSGYKFDVRSTHALRIGAGDALAVTVTGRERGGVTTPLEERPAVEWTEAPGGP